MTPLTISTIGGLIEATSSLEERNYRYFLKLYAEKIEPIAETYAYCLLPNHFHLLVRIKDEDEQDRKSDLTGFENLSGLPNPPLNPSQQFSNLFNAYTKAINKTYQRSGPLFERPFQRIPVDTDAYVKQLVIYIHRNPQHHNLVPDFRDWLYSSYSAMLSSQPTRVKRDSVWAWFDGVDSLRTAHEADNFNEGQLKPLVWMDFE